MIPAAFHTLWIAGLSPRVSAPGDIRRSQELVRRSHYSAEARQGSEVDLQSSRALDDCI